MFVGKFKEHALICVMFLSMFKENVVVCLMFLGMSKEYIGSCSMFVGMVKKVLLYICWLVRPTINVVTCLMFVWYLSYCLICKDETKNRNVLNTLS